MRARGVRGHLFERFQNNFGSGKAKVSAETPVSGRFGSQQGSWVGLWDSWTLGLASD